MAQLYTHDIRSLFSHITGEINLKLYLSPREDVEVEAKQVMTPLFRTGKESAESQ